MVNTETANRAEIRVRDITREFKRQRRRPGLGGAVRGLIAPEYDVLTAVDHISFDIEPAEVVGYIGPNGAGKSTTIKMLVGILVPTGGAWPTPATSASCSASAPSSGGTSRCPTPSR